jgi:hypothetical protein
MCDIGAVEVQDPPPPPGGGGGGKVPVVHITRLAPPAFPAAPTGGSTAAAKRRHYGTTVSYTVNEAALLLVTVGRGQVGRRGKGGRCVALTRKNRTARHCTRLIMLRGSFTVSGRAGRNRFHFTGRLRGRRLAPGRYRLQATPTAGGKRGRTAAAAFRITR